MTTDQRYHQAGWELVRELLLLRDQGDAAVHDLTTSPYFLQILEAPPRSQRDDRFAVLGKSVLEFLALRKHQRPQLQEHATTIERCVQIYSFEKQVQSLQVSFRCSRLLAHGIQKEQLANGSRRLGGFAASRILLEPNCNAAETLVGQGLSLEKLASAIASVPDSRTKPSLFALVAGAGLRALGLGHTVVGTDHLLLELLNSPRTDASRMMANLGVEASILQTEREVTNLEWRADPEQVPFLPKPMSRFLNLEPKGFFDDQQLEWSLVRALQSNSQPLLKSDLYRAIVEDDRRSPFWRRDLLLDRYEWRFHDLARSVPNGDPSSTLAAETLERSRWSKFTENRCKPTKTLLAVYQGRVRDDLHLLENLLKNPNSNASQALQSLGLAPKKLQQHLATFPGTEQKTDFLAYGRHIAGKLAGEIPPEEPSWARSTPRLSTLHILIAMLVFEPQSGAGLVLRKLGVEWSQLVEFAETVEAET